MNNTNCIFFYPWGKTVQSHANSCNENSACHIENTDDRSTHTCLYKLLNIFFLEIISVSENIKTDTTELFIARRHKNPNTIEQCMTFRKARKQTKIRIRLRHSDAKTARKQSKIRVRLWYSNARKHKESKERSR